MKSFIYRLVLLTMISAWMPARRAAAVDPATALRSGS
jgi:ABC-type lipoprotein release transport system permease subunit